MDRLTTCLSVGFKVPPCRQTRTGSSWSDHSNGPTSHRRPMTSPRSFPAFLHPAGWTGSVCATGSTKPAFRRRTGTCPPIPSRWCPATQASSPGGRTTWRNRRGPPAPCGRGASPGGPHAPSTSWMLRRSPRICCRQDNTCILSCVPCGNLRIRNTRHYTSRRMSEPQRQTFRVLLKSAVSGFFLATCITKSCKLDNVRQSLACFTQQRSIRSHLHLCRGKTLLFTTRNEAAERGGAGVKVNCRTALVFWRVK